MSLQMQEALPYVRGYRKTGRQVRTQAGEGRVGDWFKARIGDAKKILQNPESKKLAEKLVKEAIAHGSAYMNKSGSGRRKKKASRRSKK